MSTILAKFNANVTMQLLKVKYIFNLETLISFVTLISQIQVIFSDLKVWIAAERHNFKSLKILNVSFRALRVH